MATYLIKYSGAVEVEAKNKNEAIDVAWTQEGVHAEDIETIEKQD